MSGSPIEYLPCKDCERLFARSGSVKERERLAGESEPERCPEHRSTHVREYRLFAASHVEAEVDPVALRKAGGWFDLGRAPREPVRVEFEAAPAPLFPAEELWAALEAALLRRTHQVLVLVGPTGSGKSTWIPLRLVQSGDLTRQGIICVTQPRIPATERIPDFVMRLHYGVPLAIAGIRAVPAAGSALPEDLAPWAEVQRQPNEGGVELRVRGGAPEEMQRRLPEAVAGLFSAEEDRCRAREAAERALEAVRLAPGAGLDVGFAHSRARDRRDRFNRLIFMTDGTLINEITAGRLDRYSLVMIDEAHERSLNIDVILGLLKAGLPRHPRLRVMVASATVDAPRFVRYFGGTVPGTLAPSYPRAVDCGSVLLLESRGQTKEIAEIWADEAIAFLGPLGAAASLFEQRSDPPGPRWPMRSAHGDANLWYQPTFQSLIFRGVMAEDRRKGLLALRDDHDWRDCIQQLWDLSRRPRPRGPGMSAPRSEPVLPPASLRGPRDLAWIEEGLRPTAVRDRTPVLYAAVDKVLELVQRDEERLRRKIGPPAPRHILVFLDATAPIEQARALLLKALADGARVGTNAVFRFYSALRDTREGNQELEAACASPADPRQRKIVLATNLAETSLTLPGLGYVVDSGLINETYWNPEREEDEHLTILHSRAGCRQRRGRVGRDEPGEAHYLYTEAEFQEPGLRREFTVPHIQRANLEGVLLNLKRAAVDLESFQWIDPPPPRELDRALRRLRQLGALDADTDLTGAGDEILRLQFDRPAFGKLILEADRLCCAVEMATFLAFVRKARADSLRVPYLWRVDLPRPPEDRTPEEQEGGAEDPAEKVAAAPGGGRGDASKALVALCRRARIARCQEALCLGSRDDLEAYLRIFWIWESKGREEEADQWARSQGVNPEALRDVLEDRNGLLDGLAEKDKGGTASLRPLDLGLLDRVRVVIASLFQDWTYQTAADGLIYPLPGVAGAHRDPVRFDLNSVFHGRRPPAVFAALARRRVPARQLWWEGSAPTGRVLLAAHIVALDPEWLAPEQQAALRRSAVSRAMAVARLGPSGTQSPARLAADMAARPLFTPLPLAATGAEGAPRPSWVMATGYRLDEGGNLRSMPAMAGRAETEAAALDPDALGAALLEETLRRWRGRAVEAEILAILPDRHARVPILVVRLPGEGGEVPVAVSLEKRRALAHVKPGARIHVEVPPEEFAPPGIRGPAPAATGPAPAPPPSAPATPEAAFRAFVATHAPGARVAATVVDATGPGIRLRVAAGAASVTGLVPPEEVCWHPVARIDREVLAGLGIAEGRTIDAVLVKADEARRVVFLSVRRLAPHPGLGRYMPGSVVRGPVTALAADGVWVELEAGLSGFAPWQGLPVWMRERVRPGRELRATVARVEEGSCHVVLQVPDRRLRPGDVVTDLRVAAVRDDKKMVLVDLGDTRQGVIFLADWDRQFVRSLSALVREGDRVQRAVVLEVPEESGRPYFRLSRRAALMG